MRKEKNDNIIKKVEKTNILKKRTKFIFYEFTLLVA